MLASLEAFERAVLRAATRSGRDQARLLLAVFRKRALSTMGALVRSLDRRAAFLASGVAKDYTDAWRQRTLVFDAEEDTDLASAEDLEGLRASSGLAAHTERSWLKRLRHLAAFAAREERKVSHLAGLLQRSKEPAVVFTEFRDSLAVVVDRLRPVRPLSALHGGMTPAERMDALGRFQSGAASLLVATDVAGQGINLQQRCRWVVSLELPWNPTRLEQRIGRVDRIGQTRSTHLTLLVARHEAEAGILSHLARRVAAARRPFGPTTLIDVPPQEHAVRGALMDGAPLEPPADARTPVRLCTQWRRQAQCLARRLEARRALGRRWRGPALPGRPLIADLRGRAFASAASSRAQSLVLVFSVPLFDGSGALVELCLQAVQTRATSLTSELVEQARGVIARSIAPRIRRVQRLVVSGAREAAAREQAIAADLRRGIPLEAQPGLFDARGLRSYEASRVSADEIDHVLTSALDRLRRRAEVTAARPTLEVVFRVGGR
jgi:hypothetical protein